MKNIYFIALTWLLSMTAALAQSTTKDTISYAILKVDEISMGGLGSKLNIEISYDDGKTVDGKTLIPNFEKGKFMENYKYTAYLLKYMEQSGYQFISTTAASMGQSFLHLYIYRKRNK